jgi:DNA polymerase-3 subunit alpha
VIGFLISKNPLQKYKTIINKKITKKIGEITENDIGKKLILAGIISNVKKVKTKKDNSDMAIFNLFDDSGNIEIVAFPKTYKNLKNIIKINKVLLVKGGINERDGRISMILDQAVNLENVKIENT